MTSSGGTSLPAGKDLQVLGTVVPARSSSVPSSVWSSIVSQPPQQTTPCWATGWLRWGHSTAQVVSDFRNGSPSAAAPSGSGWLSTSTTYPSTPARSPASRMAFTDRVPQPRAVRRSGGELQGVVVVTESKACCPRTPYRAFRSSPGPDARRPGRLRYSVLASHGPRTRSPSCGRGPSSRRRSPRPCRAVGHRARGGPDGRRGPPRVWAALAASDPGTFVGEPSGGAHRARSASGAARPRHRPRADSSSDTEGPVKVWRRV